MTDDHSHDRQATAILLRRLSSADAGPAWVEFLELYASLIMGVANQFEYEQERIHECFLYVCEQLNDAGFRRLLKFDTTGKAAFRTWLGAVVFNLCVDWHRREYGRATLLPAISALPAFDQSVYRMVIEQGMDKETCFQSLRADFPDLTRELITRAVARVYALITPQQRWQIAVRNRRKSKLSGPSSQDQLDRLPDPGMGPDMEAQKRQDLENLQEAMALLPGSQRLLLRLRYQEGLTLKKIARLKYRGDVNRAWREIQVATEALLQKVRRAGAEKSRKN